MEIRFDDKVVLVTGASTGIGACLAGAFNEAGARVVLGYNSSAAQATALADAMDSTGERVLLVQADLSEPGGAELLVRRAVERFGRIDIVINNAGGLVKREMHTSDVTDELYLRIMELNLGSVFRVCRAAIPLMRRQGSGSIINITSLAGRLGGAGGSVVYASAKGGLATMTRGLAKELADSGIRVNAISPGIIQTPFHDRYTSPELLESIVKTIPLKRAGRPEECIGAAFFLASDAMSGYVTGQTIEVNGGMYMP